MVLNCLGVYPACLLARAGGGGAVCVMFLPEGVVEACPHHACHQGGLWDESPVCFGQRRWRLQMSVPFTKASLERSCSHASAPPASLPGVAPYYVVPDCASCHSSHRHALPQLMLPLQSLGRSQRLPGHCGCCRHSRVVHSGYLVAVDVAAAVDRPFTTAT
jgi:hypothetical protein